MIYRLFRYCFVAWLLTAGLCCHALAQPLSRSQLQRSLQRLSAQADTSDQTHGLQNWQRQWQQAGYPSDSTYINGLLQLGLAYLYKANYPAATQVIRQAVRLCQTPQPNIAADQPAKALYRLGMLLMDQNQPAVETLKQAVVRGQGIRSADQWVASAYLYLADAAYSAGDFQQTLTYVVRGEEVAAATNIPHLTVKLLHEKTLTLNELKQYGSARQAAERAITLSKQDIYPGLTARSHQLLGAVAKNQRQFTDALRHYQRAFDIARNHKEISYEAPNYAVSIGSLYYQLGRYDQAIHYFQYGLDHNVNLYDKAYALAMLGQTYRQKKAYSKSLQYYQRGLTVMPIGFSNAAITSLPEAKSIRQADQKDYLLSLIRNKADTWLDSARVANNRQCLRYALDTYKVADQMIDYMRWEHTADQSKLYWREKTRGLYERAIETCARLNDIEQAFRFFEKSRAVMLADKLNELGAQQQLSEEQANEERHLRKAVETQQSQLATIRPDNLAYKPTQSDLVSKQDSLTEFLNRLEQTNPVYYRYKYDNSTPSLTELKQYLRARNASFVTYFVGDSALYVLGVTRNRATLRQIRQPARAYRQPVQNFMALLSSSGAMNRKEDLTKFLTIGNRLYRQLLQPLGLPDGRVIVSPDGSFVPFDALSRSAGQPDYLVKTHVFSYNYSARSLIWKSVEQTQKGAWYMRDFLGIAPVEFAPKLRQVSLPGSDTALQTIAGRFGWSTLLTHEAATRQAFLNRAPRARILHLFTHAIADSTGGQEPSLYFTDAPLRLSELNNGEPLNAQLAVLGACQTGIGANQVGEGVFSLARGFASLGVPSTVSTLWSVEDQATYQLTGRFQQYLVEGMPKDSALQRAKRDWLRSHSGIDQLPGVWAGPVLIGDTESLDLPNRWPLIVGGVLLLIAGGAGLWAWRRKRRTLASLATSRPRKPLRELLTPPMTLRRSS